MEKIKNVLLQLSSNGNRMTGKIEQQRLQNERSDQLQLFSRLVIFRSRFCDVGEWGTIGLMIDDC